MLQRYLMIQTQHVKNKISGKRLKSSHSAFCPIYMIQIYNYDIRLRIHYIALKNKDVRTLSIKTFDFDYNTLVKVLDIDTRIAGDTNNAFQNYSYELNRKMVDRFLDAIKQVGKYPIVLPAEA